MSEDPSLVAHAQICEPGVGRDPEEQLAEELKTTLHPQSSHQTVGAMQLSAKPRRNPSEPIAHSSPVLWDRPDASCKSMYNVDIIYQRPHSSPR